MPEDTTQIPVQTSSASNTILGMAGAAMVEVAGAVLLEKMQEYPRFGAGLMVTGGLVIASIGGIRLWNLTKK